MLNYHAILPEPLTAMPLPAEMKSFRIPFLISNYFENSACWLLRQTWVDDSEDFYLQFTYLKVSSPCSLTTSPARDHIAASLIFLLEGNISVRELNSKKLLPRMESDFYLRRVETRHSSFVINFERSGIYRIVYISLSEKKLAALRLSEPVFNNKNILNAKEIRKAGTWLKTRILEMQQRREPNKNAFGRYLVRRIQSLFDAFIRIYDIDSIRWRAMKPVERMEHLQLYIQNNLEGNLTLRALSGMLHMNADVLRKTFLQVTGMAISKYIQQARIKKACLLLEGSAGNSMEHIAGEVGYNSLDGFYHTFEAQVGCTPKAYLKRRD